MLVFLLKEPKNTLSPLQACVEPPILKKNNLIFLLNYLKIPSWSSPGVCGIPSFIKSLIFPLKDPRNTLSPFQVYVDRPLFDKILIFLLKDPKNALNHFKVCVKHPFFFWRNPHFSTKKTQNTVVVLSGCVWDPLF